MANPIQKVVIFFMENHTTDNFASDVAGVDGDLSLPLAPDVVIPDPPHDHAHWLTRNSPAPAGASRLRFRRQQLPNLYKLMDAFVERLWSLRPSPNADAARRTTSPDEHGMADCIDVAQKPSPPPL